MSMDLCSTRGQAKGTGLKKLDEWVGLSALGRMNTRKNEKALNRNQINDQPPTHKRINETTMTEVNVKRLNELLQKQEKRTNPNSCGAERLS